MEGYFSDHHRIILKLTLQMIAWYDEAIEQLDTEIEKRMESFQEEAEGLQTIPGVKKSLLSGLSLRSEWICHIFHQMPTSPPGREPVQATMKAQGNEEAAK